MSTHQQMPPANEVELVIAYGEMDPECRDCDEIVDVQSVAAMFDDQFLCPPCADRRMPGLAQVIANLAALFDTVTFDLGPRTTPVVADVMRHMADLFSKLVSGELVMRHYVDVVEDPYADGEPCGVQVVREISAPVRTGD